MENYSEIIQQFDTKGLIRRGSDDRSSMLAALVVENSYGSRFCSDTSGVDFGKYKEEYLFEQQIPCLRETFCDNIMFFMVIPSSSISGKRTSLCTKGTEALNRLAKEFLEKKGFKATCDIKAKRTIDLCKKSSQKSAIDVKTEEEELEEAMDKACTNTITKILSEKPNILQRYATACSEKKDQENYGFISYKVSFSQYTYQDALDFCSEYKQKLAENHIYLHEIDCTADFACSFNKRELAAYFADLSREYRIIENDKTVGKNCLSIICNAKNGCVIRCKIYNKFVQSLETKSLTKRVGTHIDNWINNKEDHLRNTMSKSLENGLTRMEITFYSGDVYEKDFYTTELQNFVGLALKSNKMFKCPIEKQWRAFSEVLTCNMAIFDLDTKQYALGMWCNTLTRRVGGAAGILTDKQFENIDKVMSWVAAHFSFDVGLINIATVKMDPCPFDKKEDIEKWSPTATINLKSFAKSGEVRHTYVPGGTMGHFWYSSIEHNSRYHRKTDRSNSPYKQGLIDTPNIKFRIFSSKVEVRTKPICQCMQMRPVFDKISVFSLRKRGKILELEAEVAALTEKAAEITLENTEAIKNASIFVEHEKERSRYLNGLHFRIGRTLTDFPENTEFLCRAFKQYNGNYGTSYNLLFENGTTYRSNAYLDVCIGNSKNKIAFDNETGIYHAFDYGILFKFFRGGNYTTKNGHLAAQTTMFRGVGFSTQEANLPAGVALLQDMPPKFKRKDLAEIETLLLETTYILQGVCEYNYRKQDRYAIKIDGKYYISNHWLEENLNAPSLADASKSNYQILKEGGIQTSFRTHVKHKTPNSEMRVKCTAL